MMSTSNTKNKGYSNKPNRRYKNQHQQPRRGFPGIFFTCESGREKRCQKEALELIHHYYYLPKTSTTVGSGISAEDCSLPADDSVTNEASDEPLSLDEELAMLRKGAAAEEVLSFERNPKRPRLDSSNVASQKMPSMKSPFTVHDLGMKGIVCIVCTLPGSELIPYDDIIAATRLKAQDDETSAAKDKSGERRSSGVDEKSSIPDAKKDATNETTIWDPVETVMNIMREVGLASDNSNDKDEDKEESTGSTEANEKVVSTSPPGSRFILRMIPIQTTCHASINEIKAVTKALLKRYLTSTDADGSNDKVTTFKVDFKRRNCSHLSREHVFEAVVPLVLGETWDGCDKDGSKQKYSVNLADPDFSIRIEVCKTFCGVSILPRQKWYRNFNLAELCAPPSKSPGSELMVATN